LTLRDISFKIKIFKMVGCKNKDKSDKIQGEKAGIYAYIIKYLKKNQCKIERRCTYETKMV